jgi:hypothetical protein
MVAVFHLDYDLHFMFSLAHLLQGREEVREVHGVRQMLEINLEGKVGRSVWTGNGSGSEQMSGTGKGTENEKEIVTGSVDARKKVAVPEKMRSAARTKTGLEMNVREIVSGSVTGNSASMCVSINFAE